MFASLLVASFTFAAPRVQIDDLGALTAAPSDLRAAPGLSFVYHTQREQNRQVIQLVRNGEPQGWFRSSGIFEITPDGQDWWIRATENGRPALVVNGKFEVRDLPVMRVVTNRPPTRIFGTDTEQRLEVGGKVIQTGRQIYASMTGQGLLRVWQDPQMRWHQATDKWSLSGDAMPVHFELADGRILSRLGTTVAIDGRPIPGVAAVGEDDDVGVSRSGRNWFWARTSGDFTEFWINGQRLPSPGTDAEWISDEEFERSPILRQPTVVPGEGEESWRLIRLTPRGPQPVTERPVYATVEGSYVESTDGGAFALLAEVTEGVTGVVWNGKTVKTWSERDGETVWLGELAISPRGSELAYVDPAGGSVYVVAGSRRWGPYREVKPLRERPAIQYSANGQHVAYLAQTSGESSLRLFLNGQPTTFACDGVVMFGEPSWDAQGALRFMAIREGRVVRVTARP